VSFLLDTNICSAHLKDDRLLFHRFVQHAGNLYVSHVILAELYSWAYGAPNPTKRLNRIGRLLPDLQISEFDERTAEEFGRFSATLRRKGVTVGGFDLLIAATAKVEGHTLVTHNTRDFQAIPGLSVVDWLAP
jgi:tRNA(fMet)-specific endonuclease VapC